jgi:hypothetical protein
MPHRTEEIGGTFLLPTLLKLSQLSSFPTAGENMSMLNGTAITLLVELATALGLPEDAVNAERELILTVDDTFLMTVSAKPATTDSPEMLVFFAPLGVLAERLPENSHLFLLQANFTDFASTGATLGIEAESGEVVLMRSLLAEGLSTGAARRVAVGFSSQVRHWNARLENGDFSNVSTRLPEPQFSVLDHMA